LRPVKRLARQGLHFGLDVKQWLNKTPSRTTRSNDGVLTHLQSNMLACRFDQSSAIANTIFGRGAALPGGPLVWASARANATANADAIATALAIGKIGHDRRCFEVCVMIDRCSSEWGTRKIGVVTSRCHAGFDGRAPLT